MTDPTDLAEIHNVQIMCVYVMDRTQKCRFTLEICWTQHSKWSNSKVSINSYTHSFNTTTDLNNSSRANFNDKMQTFFLTLAVFFFAVMVSVVDAKGNCEYTQEELTAEANTCVKLEFCNPGGMCSLLSFPVCGTWEKKYWTSNEHFFVLFE